MATKQLAWLCGLVSIVGCGPSSRVEFLSSQCVPVREGNKLKSITFESSIETKGLLDSQLVYCVRLVDANSQPVRSRNGKFQDQTGAVAASRSLMVLQSPKVFKELRVSIPADELELTPDQLPVFADFGVYLINGEPVARALRPIRFLMADPDHQFAIAMAGSAGDAPEQPANESESVPPSNPDSDNMDEDSQPPPEYGPQAPPEQQVPADELGNFTGLPQEIDGQAQPGIGAAIIAEQPQPPSIPPPAEKPTATNTNPIPDRELSPHHAFGVPDEQIQPGEESPTLPSVEPEEKPNSQVSQDVHSGKDKPNDQYRLYKVQKGDTLTRIAWQQLNDSKRWREIYELNKAELNSPHWLQVGMELRLPDPSSKP